MKRIFAFTFAAGVLAALFLFVSTSRSQGGPPANAPFVQGCSLGSIRGAYGFYRTGNTGSGPLGAVGIVTYDGFGHSSFIQTIIKSGVQTSDLFTDGASDSLYSVESNCTAKFIDPDTGVFGHAVIVGGGEEIYFMSLTGTNTVNGVARRIDH